MSDLVEWYESGDAPAHRTKLFGSGGAPTAPDVIKRAETIGIRAFRVYGMTETGGNVTIAPREADLDRALIMTKRAGSTDRQRDRISR